MMNKKQYANPEQFLTELFVTVGEKSTPNMKLDVAPKDIREAAIEQAAHFQREYR